jgi:predicted negative regulator of RcsB-dependent stress response
MAGGVLLVAAVGIGWATFTHGQNTKAGEALATVLEGGADEPSDLAAAYANVAGAHTKTPAAAWAHIGEGKALYAQGQFEPARTAYQTALEASDDETIRWAALEGISYSLEAESAYDEALEQLEALRAVNRSIAPIAGYHQGRILAAQGKLDEAKTKFDWVLNALKESDAPALPFTQEQTEARLALIDPSLAPAAGSDPRQAEEVIRQMNEMLQRQPAQE